MTADTDPRAGPPAETGTRRPLDFIRPRVTRRAERARDSRTTRFVGRMRFLLPATGVAVLAVLVAWPWIDPTNIRATVMKNIPDLVVEHLHFTGMDSKDQPYSVEAARATRPHGLSNIYDLDKPEGDIQLENGSWIAGKAQYGRYDQDTRQLWLGGDVQLFHDKGYQFTTDEAQVDINQDDAWGNKPVLIQGGFGEIRGKGFQVLDRGNVVVVKGPAKATLNLRAAGPSDKPSATKKP